MTKCTAELISSPSAGVQVGWKLATPIILLMLDSAHTEFGRPLQLLVKNILFKVFLCSSPSKPAGARCILPYEVHGTSLTSVCNVFHINLGLQHLPRVSDAWGVWLSHTPGFWLSHTPGYVKSPSTQVFLIIQYWLHWGMGHVHTLTADRRLALFLPCPVRVWFPHNIICIHSCT